MTLLKCKMCGGDIHTESETNVATCEYCGSTMTIPTESDEKRINLFNRANHYRMQSEFDKAAAVYETLLNEDNSNAEAHWGLVLCRYGIEYVEDPKTHKRIPTCRRLQYQSILEDADYKSALQFAPDGYAAEQYENEAKEISEIQKRVLSVSQKEKPFDVFICYKETSETGQRTKDSVIAQDIYHALTHEGYKVFFSRITLEDKLGQEYEPYIFAALNTAKVMLVIGTKKDYFNAVWVKNEWIRFLDLMKQDKTRLLIPCYRDMDPYDLPESFSMMQGQDMGKIGFMQDLLHGIEKVLKVSTSKSPQTDTVSSDESPVNKLLSNAHTLSQLGKLEAAKKIYQRIAVDYPENPYGWYHLARIESKNFSIFEGAEAYSAIKYLKDSLSLCKSTDIGDIGDIEQSAKQYLSEIQNHDKKLLESETSIYEKAKSSMEAISENQKDLQSMEFQFKQITGKDYINASELEKQENSYRAFMIFGIVMGAIGCLSFLSLIADSIGAALLCLIPIELVSIPTTLYGKAKYKTLMGANGEIKRLQVDIDLARSEMFRNQSVRDKATEILNHHKPNGIGSELRNLVEEASKLLP